MNRIADGFRDRHALSGQRGFIHAACSLNHFAVHRNAFPGAHHEDVADNHLIRGNHNLLRSPPHGRDLRGKLHKASKRIGRFAFGARLEHLPDRNQRKNHCRRLKIPFGAVRCEQKNGAVSPRRESPHRDKRVHVRGKMQKPLHAFYEKCTVHDHYKQRKRHLQSAADLIVLKESRKRNPEHVMPHSDQGKDNQRPKRNNKAPLERRRLAVRKRVPVRAVTPAVVVRPAF